jgi:hypothetical protein
VKKRKRVRERDGRCMGEDIEGKGGREKGCKNGTKISVQGKVRGYAYEK